MTKNEPKQTIKVLKFSSANAYEDSEEAKILSIRLALMIQPQQKKRQVEKRSKKRCNSNSRYKKNNQLNEQQ